MSSVPAYQRIFLDQNPDPALQILEDRFGPGPHLDTRTRSGT